MAAAPDTSISRRRVVRELTELIAERCTQGRFCPVPGAPRLHSGQDLDRVAAQAAGAQGAGTSPSQRDSSQDIGSRGPMIPLDHWTALNFAQAEPGPHGKW